jgi:hypothetical protein
MADKAGKNKARCQKYKERGRREINKKLKAERNEKRIEKFRKRREEGKTYEYKANPYDKNEDKKKYWRERKRRAEKNVDRRLPLQKWTSEMRLLQNQVDKENALRKEQLKEEAIV